MEDGKKTKRQLIEELEALRAQLAQAQRRPATHGIEGCAFRKVFEAIRDVYFRTDLEGRIMLCSPSTVALLGYTPEELLCRNIRDFAWEPERYDEYLRQLIKHGTVRDREVVCTARDGAVRYCTLSAHLMRTPDGTPAGMEGILRDITRRKHRQAREQARADGMRAVFAATDELLACPTTDALLRRAVELARERLGVERCAIYLEDDDGQHMRGAYGTDVHGRTTDERTVRNPIGALEEKARSIGRGEGPGWYATEKMLWNWNGAAIEEVGVGWTAVTPILSLNGKLGTFFNDTARTHAPLDPVRQDIIALYCSQLGNMLERKQAEEALRASEERYRALVENTADVILRFDRQCRHLFANRAVQATTGIPPEEFIGKTHRELGFAPELVALWETQIGRVFETEKPQRVEFEFASPTGPVTFDWQLYPEFGADGRVVTVMSTSRDITRLREAERQMRRSHANLEQRVLARTKELAVANELLDAERAYFSTILDILPLPIFTFTRDKRIPLMNRAMREFGRAHHITTHHQPQMLDVVTRQAIPQEEWPMYRALHGEVVSLLECLLVAPDGTEVPLLVHAAPVYRSGEIVAAAVAFQEITELKAADRAKDEFLSILSHELLTPVTSILGWAQLAVDMNSPDLTRQALEVVTRNANRQRRILADLLDVSRIIHAKLHVAPADVELWSLAEQSAEGIAPLAQEREITLILNPPEGPLDVRADAGRIVQVISNLLNNALKFTPDGGTVTLAACRRGRHAVLTVEDTGRGIAAKDLPHLFRPFHQTHPEENIGGLGLGLALVKGIVELHGGRVQAASDGEGQGSRFTVKLPLASAVPARSRA